MRASSGLKCIISTIFIYIIIIASIADNIALGAGKAKVEAKEDLGGVSFLVGAPVPPHVPLEAVEVAFFNVGQGNCTVVKAPNKRDIFIVDAGSSKKPYNIAVDIGKAFKEDVVVKNIKKWISSSEQESYNINFIISHPDVDHKSYVGALLKLFTEAEDEGGEEEDEGDEEKDGESQGSGGSEADEEDEGDEAEDEGSQGSKGDDEEDEGNEGDGEDKGDEEKKKKYQCFYYKHPILNDPSMSAQLKPFLDTGGVTMKDLPKNKKKVEVEKKGGKQGGKKEYKYEYDYIYPGDNFSIGLLNEKFPGGKKSDTNHNSIVLLLRFYEHGMLLTGDATAKTFKMMDWDRLKEGGNIKNMIFQASHHGAHTHKSNSGDLIARIEPNISVFSAPKYSTHRHPSYQAVERISNNYKERKILPLSSVKEKELYHFFFLDKTIDSSEIAGQQGKSKSVSGGIFEPIRVYRTKDEAEGARADGLYPLYLTNYPIFHTGSHGTLIFTLTQHKIFVDTYDYAAVYRDGAKGLRTLAGYKLGKTTDLVFQNLEQRKARIALMLQVPVLSECPKIIIDDD